MLTVWIVVLVEVRELHHLRHRSANEGIAASAHALRDHSAHITLHPGCTVEVANAGGPRSAMEQTDWHQLAEDRFAIEVAAKLYKAAHAGRFDKLVVVAPPKALAVLRKEWRKEVASCIVAELAADLTHLPMGDLDRYFTPG